MTVAWGQTALDDRAHGALAIDGDKHRAVRLTGDLATEVRAHRCLNVAGLLAGVLDKAGFCIQHRNAAQLGSGGIALGVVQTQTLQPKRLAHRQAQGALLQCGRLSGRRHVQHHLR